MQYNGETNNQDIVTLSNKLVKQNNSSFPIEEKTLYANIAMDIIWSWIFLVYGGWHYDDSNHTTLPEPTTDLKLNQRQYTFPISETNVMGVAYQDEAGNWHRIKPITLEEIQEQSAEAEYKNIPGNPEEYRLTANGLILYPAASFEVTDGLKIYISRDGVRFLPTDTIAKPGFDTGHEAVPTYMALQFAEINSLKNKEDLQKKWDGNEDVTGREGGYKLRIKKHYSSRFKQMFPQAIRHSDATQDYI